MEKSDTDSLFSFAQDCQAALMFMDIEDQELAELTMLNGTATQKTIARRLGEEMRFEWLKKREKYLKTHTHAPFRLFAEWINEQAKF